MASEVSRETGDRYRWAFVFSVEGDLRFISHHDTLRLFRRALARASVPMKYSQGYNPHPRITIPLPRPVGVASRMEVLTVETEALVDADETLCRLQRHTPQDLTLLSVRRLEEGERLVPVLVSYVLEAGDRLPADLEGSIREVLEAETLEVERQVSRSSALRRVNIKPYIAHLRLNGAEVEFTLLVTAGGTAKPAEVAGLLGFEASSINHRIRRTEIRWRKIS